MANYDSIDLEFTWNGDFNLGHDGDLADTSSDFLLSLVQELHTVCASALQDWELYPNLGAGLDDFIGEPNTRTTAESIHDRLRLAITSFGLVLEDDLDITVIPVHIYRVLVVIRVNATATPNNQLSTGAPLMVSFLFDYLEQGLFFIDKPTS